MNTLTNTWAVSTQLSAPQPNALERIKAWLDDFLVESWDNVGFANEDAARLAKLRIQAATSVPSIVDALELPPPVDALDVL